VVYRQAMEHLHGVRNELARRRPHRAGEPPVCAPQLIWFRKEPNLSWFDGPGESATTIDSVQRLVAERLQERERYARLGIEIRPAEHPGRFLNYVRREKADRDHPHDGGSELEGRIKNFDRFR